MVGGLGYDPGRISPPLSCHCWQCSSDEDGSSLAGGGGHPLFAGSFLLSGYYVRSFPRYVVEWKKTKTLNSVSSRGGGRTRGCLAHHHPIDKVSTGRGEGQWERVLPLNEYFDCFWVSIHMEWNSLPG